MSEEGTVDNRIIDHPAKRGVKFTMPLDFTLTGVGVRDEHGNISCKPIPRTDFHVGDSGEVQVDELGNPVRVIRHEK